MTWPVLNLIRLQSLVALSHKSGYDADKAILEKNGGSDAGAKQGPLAELFFRHLRLSTYMVVTLVTYFWFFPLQRAAEYEVGWIAEVVARNLAIEVICYGGWHLCLYGGFGVKGFGAEEVSLPVCFFVVFVAYVLINCNAFVVLRRPSSVEIL